MNQFQQQEQLLLPQTMSSWPSVRPKRKRKVVSFSEAAPRTHAIPLANDGEIHERWYNRREYLAIRMSVLRHLKHMEDREKHSIGFELCERGLELMTPSWLAHRKRNKTRLLTAIWNSQVKQWNEHDRIHDPEAIAVACRKETCHFVNLARQFGVVDEQAAREEYLSLFVPRQHSVPEPETLKERAVMNLASMKRLRATAA
eukprot:scaffold558_cov111-Cylindrotheca_fusiformis.AAC.18